MSLSRSARIGVSNEAIGRPIFHYSGSIFERVRRDREAGFGNLEPRPAPPQSSVNPKVAKYAGMFVDLSHAGDTSVETLLTVRSDESPHRTATLETNGLSNRCPPRGDDRTQRSGPPFGSSPKDRCNPVSEHQRSSSFPAIGQSGRETPEANHEELTAPVLERRVVRCLSF